MFKNSFSSFIMLYSEINSNIIDPLFFNNPGYSGPIPTGKEKLLAYITAPFVILAQHIGLDIMWGYFFAIIVYGNIFPIFIAIKTRSKLWKNMKYFYSKAWWFYLLFLVLMLFDKIFRPT